MDTVETATNDLIHTLGNFLITLGQVRRFHEAGDTRFMSAAELGTWAMSKESDLRAALDNLRQAQNVARIDAEEEPKRDYCSLCGQWKT